MPSSNGFSTASARGTLFFFFAFFSLSLFGLYLFYFSRNQADDLCHAALTLDLDTRRRVKDGVKRIHDLSQRTMVAREVGMSGWDERKVKVEEGN